MRLLKYAAKKSLLLFGYPKFETSHPELGVYEVGALKARIASDVPACQFFYPCADKNDAASAAGGQQQQHQQQQPKPTTTEKHGPVRYFRRAAVEGLVGYLNGFGDGILQFLEEKAHPLSDTYGADPLATPEGEKFPLVLFSHGLSGTMEMYTELCAQIASTGCVVVAVEHQDGTASYAETSDGTPVPYHHAAPNSEIPYSRRTVVGFRMPKLEQRVDELGELFDRFSSGADGEKPPIIPDGDRDPSERQALLVRRIVAATDPSQLHLVGHSFGGATQLLAAQTWRKNAQVPVVAVEPQRAAAPRATGSSSGSAATAAAETAVAEATATVAEMPSKPPKPLPVPRSITVFDAWNFAMSEEAVAAGLDGGGDDTPLPPLEVTSVLSEEWATTNPEREETQEFLRNSRSSSSSTNGGGVVAIRSRVAANSVHQSVCDTEAYLPTAIATRLMNRGKGEPRHRTIRALVEAFAQAVAATQKQQQRPFAAAAAAGTPPPPPCTDRTNYDETETETVLIDYPL